MLTEKQNQKLKNLLSQFFFETTEKPAVAEDLIRCLKNHELF
jgi:hypothetical protein